MKRTIATTMILKLTILLVFAGLTSSAFAGADLLHKKNYDVSPGQLLYLKADAGSVQIDTWAKDEVEVLVYGNDEAEERFDFLFKRTNDGVEIRAEKESGWDWFSSVELRFEIKVPQKFDADVNTGGGSISVAGLSGSIDLNTSGGSISLSEGSGVLDANTSGGSISIDTFAGPIDANTSGGSINVNDFDGDLNVNTSGGSINMTGGNGRIRANTSGGSVTLEYEGTNEGIDLYSSGGGISIYLPSSIRGDVDLETSGGSVSCDMELSDFHIDKHKTELSGKLNGGGPRIVARTSGGGVRLREK